MASRSSGVDMLFTLINTVFVAQFLRQNASLEGQTQRSKSQVQVTSVLGFSVQVLSNSAPAFVMSPCPSRAQGTTILLPSGGAITLGCDGVTY